MKDRYPQLERYYQNREEINARKRAYRVEHKAEVNLKAKQYRATRKDEIRRYNNAYNKSRPSRADLYAALGLALQHAIDQGYLACYEIDCPKSKDDKNKCFDPKDYVCKRYMAEYYIKKAQEKAPK